MIRKTPMLQPALESKGARAVLFYGHDEGLQAFRRQMLLYEWALKQSFETVYGEDLKEIAISLRGDDLFRSSAERKVFILQGAGDALLPDLEPLLSQDGFSLILHTSKLHRKSKLVTFLERHPLGSSIPCYDANEREISTFLASFFKSSQIQFSPDSFNFLVFYGLRHLEGFWSDLQKIQLFSFGKKEVSLEDLERLLASEERLSSDQLERDFLLGRYKHLDETLSSCLKQGMTEIGLSQILVASLETLLFFKEKGLTALKSNYATLGRRLPFSKLDLYETALKRWSKEALVQGLKQLGQVEKKLKTLYPAFESLFSSLLLETTQIPER